MRWRSFPLEQVNNEDEGWTFWSQQTDGPRSLRAFLAAEATRDQGDEIHQKFVFALLEAVHQKKMKLQDPDTIESVARQVPGLDVQSMLSNMDTEEMRSRIERDYQEAADQYGVFGTPTLLIPGGDPVFLKMSPPAPSDEAVSLFASVRVLSAERPYVQEMKKPRKPD